MQRRKLSDRAFNKIIERIAVKNKIEGHLITERLMDKFDKDDLRHERLTSHVLDLHVKAWIKMGMPDCAHGSSVPMNEENPSLPKKAQRDEPFFMPPETNV